jgi:hypothetical protein
MENKKTDLFICECHSTEHQVVVYYDNGEDDSGLTYPMCYFHIHLNKRPFWERVKYGVKYILGRQSRFGAFDEFIINPEDSDKLQEIVDYLKDMKGGK